MVLDHGHGCNPVKFVGYQALAELVNLRLDRSFSLGHAYTLGRDMRSFVPYMSYEA